MGQAKKLRTSAYLSSEVNKYIHEQVQNIIEKANFDKLVKLGVIKKEKK